MWEKQRRGTNPQEIYRKSIEAKLTSNLRIEKTKRD
jgi:hypothetical protein